MAFSTHNEIERKPSGGSDIGYWIEHNHNQRTSQKTLEDTDFLMTWNRSPGGFQLSSIRPIISGALRQALSGSPKING